jgi:hypothetical protein
MGKFDENNRKRLYVAEEPKGSASPFYLFP